MTTSKKSEMKDLFCLDNQVAIITGGAGLLGEKHAEAIAEMGGITILADLDETTAQKKAGAIEKKYSTPSLGLGVDITRPESVKELAGTILSKFGRIDILINNAARNPKVSKTNSSGLSMHLENFSLEAWNQDLNVGLTGAFLCSQVMGSEMAKSGNGVIVNIASEYGVIAPDQRIYEKKGVAADQQNVKPVSYSVCKFGIIGLTKYLATYWAGKGIRVNALSPGGIYDDHPEEFVKKAKDLIPLGRMANSDEYKGAIVYLCSKASSFMTGANLIVDGGKSSW